MGQGITAARQEWIGPFTGLSARQFRTLVRVVAERGGAQIADGQPGRPWALPLAGLGEVERQFTVDHRSPMNWVMPAGL